MLHDVMHNSFVSPISRCNVPVDRWDFYLVSSALVFLFVKIVWVVLPVLMLDGVPRLGDDSLIYLWHGYNSFSWPRIETEASRDFVSLGYRTEILSPDAEDWKSRLHAQFTSVSASPLSFLTGILSKLGLSHSWNFAVSEIVVALTLTTGIALFLRRLFDARAAALGMLLIALSIFPRQGLHFLVASVMCLGLALILWSLILSERRNLIAIGLIALAMVFVHEIGKAYILFAIGLVVVVHVLRHRSFARVDWTLIAMLLAVLLASSMMMRWLHPSLLTNAYAGINPAAFLTNLKAAFSTFASVLMTQYFFGYLACAGVAILISHRSVPFQAAVVSTLLIGGVAAGALHDFPKTPAELSSRILMALLIVGAGFASAGLLKIASLGRWYAACVACVVMLCLVSQVPQFVKGFYSNINERHTFYNEAEIRREIAGLHKPGSVLWLGNDITLMTAGLLNGASAFRTLFFHAERGSRSLTERLNSQKHLYIAVEPPLALASASALRAMRPERRSYGFSFADFSALEIIYKQGAPRILYLRFAGPPVVPQFEVSANGIPCKYQFFAEAGEGGWSRLELGCEGATIIRIQASSSAMLTGLADKVSSTSDWPWGEPVTIKGTTVAKDGAGHLEVSFDWSSLFTALGAPELLTMYRSFELISNRGGIIWIRPVQSAK